LRGAIPRLVGRGLLAEIGLHGRRSRCRAWTGCNCASNGHDSSPRYVFANIGNAPDNLARKRGGGRAGFAPVVNGSRSSSLKSVRSLRYRSPGGGRALRNSFLGSACRTPVDRAGGRGEPCAGTPFICRKSA
jgi:hypothetical protein